MSELMTLEHVAKMFRCSSARAAEIVKLPGFPEMAAGSTRRHRLWFRSEVRSFKPKIGEIRMAMLREEAAALSAKCAAIDAKTRANRRHHDGKRRTAKLQRTPPWADLGAIERVYREAVRIENETGVEQHVDHIYPLQGKLVSGLHVAENLQVLPKLENIRKHNRYQVSP